MDVTEFRRQTYYPLRIEDHTLDDNLPEFRERRIASHRLKTGSSIGSLETLPLELLHQIIRQLDLHSINSLRCVNSRSLSIIESVPAYRDIEKYALNALRSAFLIGTASIISCEALYTTLCSEKCVSCGDSGPYIYLITCQRVCYICFTENTAFLPLSTTRIRQKFGLTKQHLKSLPQMTAWPGTYSTRRKKVKRQVFIDAGAVEAAGLAFHGSQEALQQYIAALHDRENASYQRRQTHILTESMNFELISRRMLRLWDGRCNNPLRFVAIASLPWLDKATGKTDFGRHCRGCNEIRVWPIHFRRRYSAASFLKHIQDCGAVVEGIHANYVDDERYVDVRIYSSYSSDE